MRHSAMPLYIDRHKYIEGLTVEAIADTHQKDLEAQDKQGRRPSSTGSTRTRARSSACSTRRTLEWTNLANVSLIKGA